MRESIHLMFLFLFFDPLKQRCGYSLEVSMWGASNEYHNTFLWKIRKISVLFNWKSTLSWAMSHFQEPTIFDLIIPCTRISAQSSNFIIFKWQLMHFYLLLYKSICCWYYCPFNIIRKDVFRLAFNFKWKYFVLIYPILSETICLFCFCILVSNIYPKIKFTAKNWPDLCNFNSKVIFWNFCLRKYFLLFFAEFELLMFHNNIVKISEKLNKWNLLKICHQITYPIDFCIICVHFYYGKKWKYFDFLKTNE